MAFDCMAIAMGLFASVMATWEPNERFTYGYSRIETLSGFANGIFLILISVFIIVEAVQRLIDPPEMNTRQLLLVSTVGLGVNLFGMFAMGGHHHHEHSHSHSSEHEGHSHSEPHPSDSHIPSTPGIRLESPTDEHFIMLDPPTAPSSTLLTPVTPSSVPFTPITPSYSFTYDDHLQTHHPEIAHSHDHSASHEGHSHNMRGVFLHVMADTLGSVGVIISTLLINIYGWTGFDPIASMFIAILIAVSVIPLVIDTGKVLALDLGGKEGDVERALQEISGIKGVQSYTEARFWPLEQNKLVGSIHIQVSPGYIGVGHSHSHGHHHGPSRLDQIRESVEHVLKSRIKGLDELVIQLDG
ncbi:putative zinc transporter msc2 [Serendipita sp. 399]|nr:putative zinc transporter msc2 [Serendipita sp. 399]